MMDDYNEVYEFCVSHRYPAGCSKNEKRSLRRKCQKHYKVEKGVLFYRASDQHQQWREVPRDSQHIRRILNSCHSSLEGKWQQ